jgi:osmotically-inducible protein OsmY
MFHPAAIPCRHRSGRRPWRNFNGTRDVYRRATCRKGFDDVHSDPRRDDRSGFQFRRARAAPGFLAGFWKDADIRLAVLEAIHCDLAIPPGWVAIDVSEGRVVLTGRVQRGLARHRAEWAARLAPGVVGVTNEITIGS